MKKYTVVGVERGEGQCITDHVMAKSPEDAIRKFFQARAYPEGTDVIDVFHGHLISRHPSGFAVNSEDM